jgi:hypothetical protein
VHALGESVERGQESADGEEDKAKVSEDGILQMKKED